MKKHIPLILGAMTLCLLPPLCILPPLLFGAGGTTTAVKKNCGYIPFNGPCNYSAGCNLKILTCSTFNGNQTACTDPKTQETQLAVNLFSCNPTNPPDQTKACDPVLNQNGTAATTDCVIVYNCVYASGVCTQGSKTGSCKAPYYQQDTCP